MNLGQTVKTFSSTKGNQVVIRYIQESDLDNLLKYANDLIDEDTYVGLSGKKITRKAEEKYLKDAIRKVEKGEKIHLVALVNGVFASSAEVRRLDRRSAHVGEIGIAIAKPYRSEGIGSVILQTLISEAKKLDVKLLTLKCFECNDVAIHVYEKLGFTKAGVIPGMYHYKQNFVGEVLMFLPL